MLHKAPPTKVVRRKPRGETHAAIAEPCGMSEDDVDEEVVAVGTAVEIA